MSSNFGGIPPLAAGLVALERLKTYNLVSALAPSFLIGFSSFLQVRRTTKNLGQLRISARFNHILRSKLPLSV